MNLSLDGNCPGCNEPTVSEELAYFDGYCAECFQCGVPGRDRKIAELKSLLPRFCKTWAYWKTRSWNLHGECDLIDNATEPNTRFEIKVTVADDHDLETRLLTGPDFGCVLHKPKAS